MTLENANPIIVAIILLPFVLCCFGMIAGALNHWWKHKEEDDEAILDETQADYCSLCGMNVSVLGECDCNREEGAEEP